MEYELQRERAAARVSLLIPTHALPPLSYRVPPRLRPLVRPGAVVVAPLYGRSRLGVVVSSAPDDTRATESLRSVVEGLALPAELLELCRCLTEREALPLPAALRAALPPGLDAARYRVSDPAPQWPWPAGSFVRRPALERALGPEGLAAAESGGRLELAPLVPAAPAVEWALTRGASAAPDLARAPRQRELYDALVRRGGECAVPDLLAETGVSRPILRALVRRGAVALYRRPLEPPLLAASGGEDLPAALAPFAPAARRALRHGGAWVWRMPSREHPAAVCAAARSALERGERALVLAPEVSAVEDLARALHAALPAGRTVAPYHNGLDRPSLYDAARRGAVDVLVGTRTAALVPLPRLGVICVVDEPNPAHRPERGYGELPLHVRDAAIERARIEGASVLYLSPYPSLHLYGSLSRTGSARPALPTPPLRELSARPRGRWPAVRIVDLRGSGASLSSTLLAACARAARSGRRVGVVANRLGYATALRCNRCGAVRSCPECGAALARHRSGALVCPRCDARPAGETRCESCGSGRLSPTGAAVERLRELLSAHLGEPVGLLTAAGAELADSAVVVGTARPILEREWDAVALPDPDASLLAPSPSSAEKAFRTLYGAAACARELLVVQTRFPEHPVLRAAVRGDYPAFARAELVRRRELGYPPFAHLAALSLEGERATVRRAVESRLRPALDPGVELSGPVPARTAAGGPPAWRLLLRARDRPAVARAAGTAARLVASWRGLKARVEIDPEEV